MDKENLPTKNETSWIYSVTKNETLNYFKSNRNNITLDDIYEIEDNNQEISKIIDQENYKRLISKLNDNEKEIISLKIISNFSFEEIGKILNMPTGTVKWRYYKAINTLKLLLSNLTMFIISFISSIYALKSTKKIISPIQEENVIENIVIAADENQKQQYEKSENTQQNSQEEINTTIIEETNENEVNYPAIGLMGISTVFLMLTIIFSIIFAKYQLKLKKNLSKQQKGQVAYMKKIIIILVIILIGIVVTMYLIDFNKMKNGEEVIFGTWGKKYSAIVKTKIF